jgi:hypothetical protein
VRAFEAERAGPGSLADEGNHLDESYAVPNAQEVRILVLKGDAGCDEIGDHGEKVDDDGEDEGVARAVVVARVVEHDGVLDGQDEA